MEYKGTAKFAQSMHSSVFIMERTAMFLYVFLSQYNWIRISSLVIFFSTNQRYAFYCAASDPTFTYFHYVFVLERIAMALVALDYFPSLSFKSCWVLATIIFAGTNIFRILAYYFDGRRPAQEDFGSLNPTDPEGEEVEKEKVGIREESSSNLKCLEEILETIDHDEEIVKAEDNLDVVQGITQNRCSEEPKIELDKVVEEKGEQKDPIDEKDEQLDGIKLQNLKESYDNLKKEKDQCEQELHKARENYNKLFSSWVEVKNNLQASLESSEKQLLKWEEDKQELLAQIKDENARKELYKQLDTSDKSWQHYQNNERSSAESYKLQEERGDLQAQLLTATSTYWHRVNRLTEEKNDLESKLDAANSKVEYYDEGWKDCEETCSKLKEENLKLSVLLSCETASVARVNELMHKLEEKCRRLEEEKINLTADLCASKAIAEIYRNCMHDLDCSL
ncbi:uncharacterized protein LOC131176317 [Hevea brasiliensis]|uniref:uncharacterized protein LOC131176317 n=1 Tax=Hevea brasiliensis TaxID=3981 RepID=UPI0025D48964|nr:uncharacterized protein LOC131176317 [Hevea brasiliensis]